MNKHFFKLVVLILMFGASTLAQAQGQSPNVYLKVNDTGTALEVWADNDTNTCDPADTGDDDTTVKGYMCFKKGNSGLVNLHLPTDGNCGEVEGARWHITEVKVGGEGSKTKPASDADWGGLSKGAASDLGANQASGVVDITPAQGGSVVNFKNDNGHEIVFWYTVTAMCTKGEDTYGDPIKLDPRGRNGGTS